MLADVDNRGGLDEKALYNMELIYGVLLKDQQKADYYKNIEIKKYPLGFSASRKSAISLMSKQKDENVETFAEAISEFQKKFGYNNVFANNLRNKLIEVYSSEKKYKELLEFVKKNLSAFNNNLANIILLSTTAKSVFTNGGDIKIAKELINLSYRLFNNFNKADSDLRGLTNAQFKSRIKTYSYDILYNASLIYEKTDGPEAAMKFVKEGYANGKPTTDLKAMYAKLLIALNQDSNEAFNITGKLLSDGNFSDEIINTNKKAYKLVNHSEKGYKEYYDKIREHFLSHLKEEYKKKLIDKPAPDFSLFDLDGNKVTLSKLKGKIVIIDLWATWCHWCIKAFPLMKEAQEKYKNDKNVVFLFMDTFEQGNKQKGNARKFMTENNYPFHVILDTDSKAAKSYGVRGIPTKLFIGKKGRLRFVSVGYRKDLLNEIDVLIEILN